MTFKVYIGFSIDMDRAYSEYNIHGNIIGPTNPEFDKYNNLRIEFVDLTTKLIDYFYRSGYSKSVTWFVNEADYNITIHHKDILQKCIDGGGEIGLHTHFNSTKFNSDPYHMSDNKEDWLNEGILEPTKRLNQFCKQDSCIFKSGNHLRNDEMYNTISDYNYSIDTTMVINDTNTENGHLMFDDTGIKVGTEPYFIKCANGNTILEIPEIRCHNVFDHIDACKVDNRLCFIKLQIHHWQYDELIPMFDDLIVKIKSSYEVEFISLKDMQRLYFDKLKEKLNNMLKQEISQRIPNDEYYNSLRKLVEDNFLDIATYLFNNYDKQCKVLELFSGIGQCSAFLNKLGFLNVSILDLDTVRVNFYNNITNSKSLVPICINFFDFDITDYNIIFLSQNSIGTSLTTELDVQVDKYKRFLNNKTDNTLVFNYKYASYSTKEGDYILEKLDEFEKIYINEDYVIIKNSEKPVIVTNFSKDFKTYKIINFANIDINTINTDNKKEILIKFSDNVSTSAGIYFPLFYKYSSIPKEICKYKIIFKGKVVSDINTDLKFKIYTGIKWIVIEEQITQELKQFELEDNFDFNKPSTYRIGFVNTNKGDQLIITDFDLLISSQSDSHPL